mgnify:CR=1 FL=1
MKAFTLIELLVVLAIIMILTAIVVPQFLGYTGDRYVLIGDGVTISSEMSKKGCDQLRLSKIQEVTVDKVREIEAKLECRKIRRDN